MKVPPAIVPGWKRNAVPVYEISTRVPSVIFSSRRRNEISGACRPGWSSSGRIRSILIGRRVRSDSTSRCRRWLWPAKVNNRVEDDDGGAIDGLQHSL